MSAGQFLKLLKLNPGSIKRSIVIPPKLGSDGYGSILVEFK